MKETVIVTHPIPRAGLKALFDRFEVYYPENGRHFTTQELLERLPACDAALACGPFTAEMITASPKLKIISNYGAGYDRVDVSAADEAGVIVTNIPDSTAEPTAELAFALLIDCYRRISWLDRHMRADAPEKSFGMGLNMAHDLAGSTLGIVGMGRIGQALCRMARAFGMNIAYHNRHRLPPEKENGAAYMSLDELLKVSDAVSIHCPLTEETRGLIGQRELALMKTGAVLINTSRGGTVDYIALCDALEEGKLRGAGLDVFPDEPHVPERLLRLDNVTLTPHVGTNTYEARDAMAAACAERIIDVLDGRRPPNMVNRALAKARAVIAQQGREERYE